MLGELLKRIYRVPRPDQKITVLATGATPKDIAEAIAGIFGELAKLCNFTIVVTVSYFLGGHACCNLWGSCPHICWNP